MPTHATKGDFEFLVKHRGVAYLHAAWCSALEIEALSVRARTVLDFYTCATLVHTCAMFFFHRFIY